MLSLKRSENDDYGYSIQQTSDGGYIIGGETWGFGAGLIAFYLIKTDSAGTIQWSKIFGGTNADEGVWVQQCADGGFIFTGVTYSISGRGADVYLSKTDSTGTLLWSKTYGGSGDDFGYSVRQTTDEGFIIVGYTASFSLADTDIYVIKTDYLGDTLWTKTFGGTGYDAAFSVQQTLDGDYIISGETRSFGTGGLDVYLIWIDANGSLLSSKTFGGIYDDFGYSVQQTADGGYIVTGGTTSFGNGLHDVYLIKTDANINSGCSETYPQPLKAHRQR